MDRGGSNPETSSRPSSWIVRRRNGRVLLDLSPPVFVTSSVLIIAFVAAGVLYRQSFGDAANALQATIANHTGWFFVLTVNIVLGYSIFLLCSRFGAVRLGGPGASPLFGRGAWLSMLFSAGMGIGLLFYAVAEPIYHLANPPHGATPGSVEAYRDAITTTFLHWGLHAWGIYALSGVCLAYFAFNRLQPLSIRSVFLPLLGNRVYRWPGHLIDTLATVATLFGVATSLGLGAIQLNAGLNHLVGVPEGVGVRIGLIAGITLLATISVVLGIDRGIKRLSILNVVLAGTLLAFVFAIGPTLFVLNAFGQGVGAYLNDLIWLGFWNETYTRGSWQNGWTVFYWGWWIAWAPFVGIFLARISFGRTIREFIAGTLLAATLMTLVWLSVFGNAALYIELAGPGGLVDAVQTSLDRSLFVFLEMLPQATQMEIPPGLITAVGVLAAAAIVSFFVTSSDSGSLVIDIITAGGKPNPPRLQRVYWATAEGVVAAVLLAGGGLTTLQTAAISAGLPFAVVILLMIVGMHRALVGDTANRERFGHNDNNLT
jgi:choline/glycine/proline betaine transport protein